MSFYFIGPSSAGLSQHLGTPDISSSTVVLTTGSGVTSSTVVLTTDSGVTIFPRIQLLKVHGKYVYYYKLKERYLICHLTYNSLINLNFTFILQSYANKHLHLINIFMQNTKFYYIYVMLQ